MDGEVKRYSIWKESSKEINSNRTRKESELQKMEKEKKRKAKSYMVSREGETWARGRKNIQITERIGGSILEHKNLM